MITLQNKHKGFLKLIFFPPTQGIAFLQKLDGLTKLHTVQMEGNPVWSSGEYAYHLVTCLPALQVRGFLLALFRKSFTLMWYLSMNLRQRLSKLGWSTTVVLVRSEFKLGRREILLAKSCSPFSLGRYHASGTKPEGKFSKTQICSWSSNPEANRFLSC